MVQRYRKPHEIKKIVMHHSAVEQPNLDLAISSFNRNHAERLHPYPNDYGYHISYHYVIGVDGEIRHTRPNNEIGYHAGDWRANVESIGICLSGDMDKRSPYEKQYSAARELIAKLKWEYGDLTVHGHKEFDPSKTCPGNFYQMYKVLMLFYEKLWRDNYESINKDDRIFKDPEAFLDRVKDLGDEEKFKETVFLIANLVEKLGLVKLDK